MAKPPEPRRKAPPHATDPLAPYKDDLRAFFPSKDALLEEARSQRQRKPRTAKALAGLALAMAALWLADPAWQTTRLSTAIGERSAWTLRDGTRIQLNTDSVALVENRLRSRRLLLDHGEAMITVAQGWRGFVVQAAGMEIRDIGTVFNVRRDGTTLDVAVVQGAVEVQAESGGPAARLDAGQALTVSAGLAGVPGGMGGNAVAWADGKLVFDRTPLRAALADMQRYRRAPIRLHDERAGNLRLSGEYPINGLESLLDALPEILPVSAARRPDGAIDIGSR